MTRTESYVLYHGTTKLSAYEIIANGFKLSTCSGNWCGSGVYFYDIKAKAWWAARRKAAESNLNQKRESTVLRANINNLDERYICDLRQQRRIEEFERFAISLTEKKKVSSVDFDTQEALIQLRSLIIEFFAEECQYKLVIGHYEQRPQIKHEEAKQIAERWGLAFGIETIYCVKDTTIITELTDIGNTRSEGYERLV